MVPRVVGVLHQPVVRVRQRRHEGREAAVGDQVVEHRGERRVVEVVPTVVHHQEWVPGVVGAVVESHRVIDGRAGPATERLAVEHQVAQASGRRSRSRVRPFGIDVPGRLAHRVGAERVAGGRRVERILDEVAPEAVGDGELVLEARPIGHGQRQRPPLAVGHRLEPEVGGQADAEVGEVHRDHRADEGERAGAVGDHGKRLAGGAPGVERAHRQPRRPGHAPDQGVAHVARTCTVRPTSSSISRTRS